jgi:hypothetical protein
VRRPQWVDDCRPTPRGWRLSARGREQGLFDAVALAHNGKCLNRLLGPMRVPALLRQARSLRLSSNWVLMVAFGGAVAAPGGMQGAHVRASPVLAWAANNSAKLGLPSGGCECWTLVSTQEFGKLNKVPQVCSAQELRLAELLQQP